MVINSAEFQNNVGKFLQYATTQDVVITKNGKEIARLVGAKKATSFLTDSLIGLLPTNFDEKSEKSNYFANKHLR